MDKRPYREGDEPPAGHMLVSDEEGNKHWVRPEDLKKSPLRHVGVPPKLLNVIRWQWRHLAPHSPAGCQSFEAWERGFL